MGTASSTLSLFTSVFDRLLGGNKEYRILMLGLDAAGKTTLLYRLKLGEVETTVPTIGFNVEQVQYNNKISFVVWDVGGQDRLRMLWRHYYENVQALIFVVDSADVDRLDVAKQELQKLVNAEELKDAIILIFANKQDLAGAVKASEMAQRLSLPAMKNQWYIQPCVATDGQGLCEGLDWLSDALSKTK